MTDVYEEGFKDMIQGGVNRFQTATKGITDNELNSLYNVFKQYDNSQTTTAGAKEVMNQVEPPTADPATPQPTDTPPVEVPDEQAESAAEITAEAEADPTPTTPEEAALPPEEKKRQDAAKGGHVAQILKKVGLAKTPTSRVLSQALMALDIDDLIAVKNAAVVQADRLAKRQAKVEFTTTQGIRIIENALLQLENSYDTERIF